jgi:hypothetical protein
VASDLRNFFWVRPALPTRIRFASRADHQAYSQRILQRLGTPVMDYAILNIHQIGIDAPIRHVFDLLLNWNGDSTCWPNHLATVERVEDRVEHIRIFPLGRQNPASSGRRGVFGLTSRPLFLLDALRIQRQPGPADDDNARYLLFQCRGGYPIGIFAMYARSSIQSQAEREPTQLFMVVSFDFFGRNRWPALLLPVRLLWTAIHDRVTANVLNRFKQLCEWRFSKLQTELASALGQGGPDSTPPPGSGG